MVVLVFLVSLGIVSAYQTTKLANLLWPAAVNAAALIAIAAAFLGLVYLVLYLGERYHPIRGRAKPLQKLFAGSSSLCHWDFRIGLGVGAFLVSTLSILGQSCLWFEQKIEGALHSLTQLLTILPKAPRRLYGRFTSPRTHSR